jgi:hypothetical protein
MVKNRLHKYVSIGTLKRILGGTIRMSQPSAFNDPFELLPELIIPADQAGKSISFSFDIDARRRETPLTAVVQLNEGQVSSDITSRHILDVLNKYVGILCLSKAPNSILMWSHYADQYQGAVVAFDADHEFFARQIEVEYVEERPKKPSTRISRSANCAPPRGLQEDRHDRHKGLPGFHRGHPSASHRVGRAWRTHTYPSATRDLPAREKHPNRADAVRCRQCRLWVSPGSHSLSWRPQESHLVAADRSHIRGQR